MGALTQQEGDVMIDKEKKWRENNSSSLKKQLYVIISG